MTVAIKTNLAASVRQRLLNLARERRADFQLILIQYAVGFRGHNTNFADFQSATDRSACEERGDEPRSLPKSDVLAQEIVEDLLTRRGRVKIADAEAA